MVRGSLPSPAGPQHGGGPIVTGLILRPAHLLDEVQLPQGQVAEAPARLSSSVFKISSNTSTRKRLSSARFPLHAGSSFHIYLNIKAYASYTVSLLSISIWNLKIKPFRTQGPPPQGRRRPFSRYNHCLRITVASNSAPS